jgi:hypothetical protein
MDQIGTESNQRNTEEHKIRPKKRLKNASSERVKTRKERIRSPGHEAEAHPNRNHASE